jgi:hypothetical protein
MYQLRKYTLKDRESLDFYRNVVYPRHFVSFAKFGMAIHGIWTAPDPVDLTLYVLFSFAEQDDPTAVLAEYVRRRGDKRSWSVFVGFVVADSLIFSICPSGRRQAGVCGLGHSVTP